MKFSTLAFAGLALAESQIHLKVQDDSAANGLYLSSIHEGAGINYFLLGANGENLLFNGTAIRGEEVYEYPFNLGVIFNYLALGPSVSPLTVSFNGDVLNPLSGSYWACKNTLDPYGYTKSQYIIALGETKPFDECFEVTIVKEDAGAVSLAAPLTLAPVTATTPAAAVSVSAHQWNTTTQYITTTDYVTYCPFPTTVTITTCSENRCAPHTVTVTEAKTLTVTGPCLVPVGPSTPVSQTTPAPKVSSFTTVHSSVAAESHAPSIQETNGGAKAAAGIGAALVGALAVLL